MEWTRLQLAGLRGDRRGFTRLEFSLLTAMLCAMVINGIVTLGAGIGGGSLTTSSRPMSTYQPEDSRPTSTANIGRAIR